MYCYVKRRKVLEGINDTKVLGQKPKKNVKGAMAGLAAGMAAQTAAFPIGMYAVNKMAKYSKSLSQDQVNIVNSAADNILSNVTNLKEKGVEIIHMTKENAMGITDLFNIRLPECLKNLVDMQHATANGKNAFFLSLTNTVNINRDKLPLAVFHELGHAYNFHNSGFWKAMQKLRGPGMALAGLLALIPIFTKEHKAQDGKELTKGQKFKNKLRNASPILAFASMLPMLGEEAMASIRGCKWAKQLLDKNLFKKVTKGNAIAYCSYLATALGFAAFAFVAKKVKDHFQAKNEAEALKAN